MVNDSSDIKQIKSKYKDLYNIDVKVEYDEEHNVYLIETEDNKIIYATDSLDKELDRLNTIEESNQRSSGGGYLNTPQSIGERRKERALNADEVQIYMFFSSMISVIGELDAMASMPLSCNTSYADCLSGELRTYYDGLGDNTKAALKALANSISGISGATTQSLILYDNTSKEDFNDLKDLINELYNQSDMEVLYNNFMDQDIGDTPMSYDEYAYIFDNMGELFDGSYQDILDRFKSNLALGYQDFLRNTVPSTLDNIVENTYLRISEEDIGSKAYLEGLEKYKNSFALKVLGDFDLNSVGTEDSNIPAYLWTNDTSDYDKALLVLSYNNDNFSNSYQDNFINVLKDSAEDNNLNADYIENHSHLINKSFNILEKTNNFYLKDFDKEYGNLGPQEKLKKIIKEYDELLNDDSDIGISKDVLYRNMSASAGNESGEAWEKTLKDFGYLDKIEGKYDTDVLYKETFTNEFIGKIIENEGQDKVYQVLRSYYRNYGLDEYEVEYKLNSIFREMDPYLINTVMNYNINVNLRNNLGITYNQLVQDKITLDASKAQFKMGLLENLDTGDITDADIIDAKKLLGADAAYLTDWQIKGYYKLYKNDQERANELLKDTLYNTIMDGRGYVHAQNVYNGMTGEDQKRLLNKLTHDAMFSDIWGKTSGFIYTGLQGFTDGLGNSIRNVADLFAADGKMDENDYYLMHLQNMLSAGGAHNEILKLTYNASSSVGNMAPAMALSAFVSPLAMSAWILASETGSHREQALRNGEDNDFSTFMNSAAHGLIAVGTERFLGALNGYGAKSDDLLKIFNSDNSFITKFMETTFGKNFALGLSNSVNETIQELTENALGHGIDFLAGKNIDWQNIPQETWETIYMTMLTTPFINKMGEGFRNNKHSLINKMNTYNFNGFNVEYSQAELLQFTDGAGKVDKQGFFKYLMENKRFKNIKNSIKRLFGINQTTNFDINSNNVVNNEYVDIRRIINGIMSKNNCSRIEATKILEAAITEHNFNFITRNGNAREIASKYTYNQLNEMLLSLKNLNLLGEQYDLFSVITRKNDDSTYKKPSELFRAIGETSDTTYGVNQSGLLYLTSVIDENGNVLSASQAMKKIQDCQNKGLPLPHFRRRASQEYDSVKNFLVDNYGMSKSDASILLTSVDDKGACSYASVANEIFTSFIGKEQEFQKKFGFSMYDSKTNKPNYNQLLADLYLNYNTDDYGGKLLTTDTHGNVVVDKRLLSSKLDPLGRHILDASNQMYLSTTKGKDVDRINRYLGMKGIEYKSSVLKEYNNYKDNQKITSLAKKIQNGLKNGKSYSMGVYSYGSDIHFISTDGSMHNDSTRTWNEGDGHSVFISNVSDDGIIVASWGHEFLIPFNDLKNQKAMWLITESDIVVK